MVVRWKWLVWVLAGIYNVIPKLPYCTAGARMMHWILVHTPADPDERL